MTPCDWLIVGGGIHGVHIAARLIAERGVAPDALRIIDPAPQLLARWRQCTQTTGMTHLRSPAVHHLGLRPGALSAFAGRRRRASRTAFAAPYNRPALALFDAHCDHVIETFRLADTHLQGRVETASCSDAGVEVVLDDQRCLSARHVVLAMGAGEALAWPDHFPRDDPRLQHIFSPTFRADAFFAHAPRHVAVVGGGISAAQVALRAHAAGCAVTVISNRQPSVHQFDSAPAWLGPKAMTSFLAETRWSARRAMIAAARNRGSLPPGVKRAIGRALATDTMTWCASPVAHIDAGAPLTLQLMDGTRVAPDTVLLATGFETRRPGSQLVDDLVRQHNLPCADCGYPIVDASLQWGPGIFTTGPLAELALGPVARNIAGARRAADRIVQVA